MNNAFISIIVCVKYLIFFFDEVFEKGIGLICTDKLKTILAIAYLYHVTRVFRRRTIYKLNLYTQ